MQSMTVNEWSVNMTNSVETWGGMCVLVSVVAMVALCGCATIPGEGSRSGSWLKPAPDGVFQGSTEEHIIPSEDICIVPEDKSETARSMLSSAAIIPVDEKLAGELLEGAQPHVATGQLYLVRAVRSRSTSGEFECKLYLTRLRVAFLGMARATSKAENVPLIVRLPKRPTAVYVENYVME